MAKLRRQPKPQRPRVEVDLNTLGGGGLTRARWGNVQGELREGQLVDAIEPVEGVVMPAHVEKADRNSPYVLLRVHRHTRQTIGAAITRASRVRTWLVNGTFAVLGAAGLIVMFGAVFAAMHQYHPPIATLPQPTASSETGTAGKAPVLKTSTVHYAFDRAADLKAFKIDNGTATVQDGALALRTYLYGRTTVSLTGHFAQNTTFTYQAALRSTYNLESSDFRIDGMQAVPIKVTKNGTLTYEVPYGTHVFTWGYQRSASGEATDAFLLKSVTMRDVLPKGWY